MAASEDVVGAVSAVEVVVSGSAAEPVVVGLPVEPVVSGVTDQEVLRGPVRTLRNILTVAMLVNLFLLLSEVFTEFYTDSAHVASTRYLFLGLHGRYGLVPWIWTAIALNLVATLILVFPISRRMCRLRRSTRSM